MGPTTMISNSDTICAISTAPGVGGIAVIRVSGATAQDVVAKMWRGVALDEIKSHTAHLGKVTFDDGDVLDEVVLTMFRAPNSFTGENVVEIACHGSQWIQQQLVNQLVKCGSRVATAGEFTQRAFSNGRIDLSQAEAIADVIASSSRASHRIAMNQMRGAFSRELSSLREQLLDFVSLIELELDFSEEEVEFADRSRLLTLAGSIKRTIDALADSFAVGDVIKNGLPVAIVGETNAGKSTLLNYLLRDDRALVSDVHGTTRDVIEDVMTLGGTLFRFIDTAGIRETDDVVETLGIERTFKKLSEARLVLWVIDGKSMINDIRELSTRIVPDCEDKSLIVVVNKVDEMGVIDQEKLKTELKMLLPEDTRIVMISAKNHTNVSDLQDALVEAAAIPENSANEVIVTNARHFDALVKAGEAITRAVEGLENGISGDFVSQDIRECMHYLGEITGEITTHDILGNIFSRFCIGK